MSDGPVVPEILSNPQTTEFKILPDPPALEGMGDNRGIHTPDFDIQFDKKTVSAFESMVDDYPVLSKRGSEILAERGNIPAFDPAQKKEDRLADLAKALGVDVNTLESKFRSEDSSPKFEGSPRLRMGNITKANFGPFQINARNIAVHINPDTLKVTGVSAILDSGQAYIMGMNDQGDVTRIFDVPETNTLRTLVNTSSDPRFQN